MNVTSRTTLAISILLTAPTAYGQGNTETPLTTTDPAAGALLGYSTAVHGARVVVGARGAAANGIDSGAAYIFDRVSGQQTAKLVPMDADPGDIFGNTVALEGDIILVGSDREDGNENGVTFLTNSGSAYVFDAATGQQLLKLRASTSLSHAHFGRSVSMSGGLAAIGSDGINAQGVVTGTTYVFDVATGQELTKLLATDGEDEDRLGESVSISQGLVVAGAVGDDDNGTDAGSAYVFDAVTGAQVAKLLPSDGAERDSFGNAVAISGDRAVIGARRDDDNGLQSGSAYLFDVTTGQQLMKLLPLDGAAHDNFGHAVAITDVHVLVSAPQDDDLGDKSGSVYVFDRATGQQVMKLTAANGGVSHFFGYGLSASGGTAAIGSPFTSQAGSSTGSASLFDLSTGSGGVISYCGPTSANSVSMDGALLASASGFGTAQATFDIGSVPNSFGILFVGDVATDVTLGCGTRCVGGNIVRGPILMASSNQILGATFDMGQPSATHIQYWYRDTGTCGSDLSNALTR